MEKRINEWLDKFSETVVHDSQNAVNDKFWSLFDDRVVYCPPECPSLNGKTEAKTYNIGGPWAEIATKLSRLDCKLEHFEVFGNVIIASVDCKGIGLHGEQKSDQWWQSTLLDTGGELKAIGHVWASKIPYADLRDLQAALDDHNKMMQTNPSQNMAKIDKFFADDAVILPPNHAPVRGIDAIMEFTGELAVKFSESTRIEAMMMSFEKIGDSYAVVVRTKVFTGDVTSALKGLMIWKRFNGDFKCTYDIWNSD